MNMVHGMEHYTYTGETAITIGKFDGLHLGHQKLLQELTVCAEGKYRSVMVAFDFQSPSLLDYSERASMLQGRVDDLLVIPFRQEFKSITPMDFIQHVLVDKLHAKQIVVGTDFRFGLNRMGDVSLLQSKASQFDYLLRVMEKQFYDGSEISSSRIKEALQEGDIQAANAMLGYAYPLHGVVEHGRQLARRLGFPTLNFKLTQDKIVPKHGVYYARVCMLGDISHGLVNIGMKPTVTKEQKLLVEVHVLDKNIEGYEEFIEIELVDFLRPEKKFSSIDELKDQIAEDSLWIRERYINLI